MRKSHLILFACIVLFSCKSEDPEPTYSDNFENIIIWDIGNSNSASDLRVDIVLTAGVFSEIRLFISKENAILSYKEALELPAERYHIVNVNSSTRKVVKFSESLKDTEGMEIKEDIRYVIQMISVENKKLSAPSVVFSLSNLPVLNGRYKGLWNDNFYTDFAISADIIGSGNNYSGEFYYSDNNASCCGGSDDGRIYLTIENGLINKFIYNQDLLNYMGGCPGRYDGSGKIVDDINFNIDFEGLDCDGKHIGGKIELSKVR